MRFGRRVFRVAATVAGLATAIHLWWNKPAPKPEDVPPLRIGAYSSFTSSWGPGPSIVQAFEQKCNCKVVLEDIGDAGLLVQKLKMTSGRMPDLIIGFDRFSAEDSGKDLKWRHLAHLQGHALFRGAENFVRFDWAPIAFVYRKSEIEPPRSFVDLLSPRFKNAIALEDPRTSTPGLQFVDWVVSAMGEKKADEYLKALKPNIHSVSPSWSGAYGLFKKKQAKLVLSYLTSPLYHLISEKDDSFAAAVFEDGHAVQDEFAAIPENAVSHERAQEFLSFLLEEESQHKLMEMNYMLPATADPKGEFAKLPKIKVVERQPVSKVRLLEIWKEVYSE